MELEMDENISIKDAMTFNVITATSDTTISEIATIMAENHISAVVIEDQKVEGIVTSSSIIAKVVSKNLSPESITADMIMSKYIKADKDTNLVDASTLMSNNNTKLLLIMDAEDKLEGIITLTDIVRISPEMIKLFVEKRNIDGLENSQNYSEDEYVYEGTCDKCGVYGPLETSNGQYLCSDCLDEEKE